MTFAILALILGGLLLVFSAVENQSITSYGQTFLGIA